MTELDAVAELRMNGRLLCRLEQVPEDELDELEAAAIVVSLRQLANALEATSPPDTAEDVLEQSGATWTLDT